MVPPQVDKLQESLAVEKAKREEHASSIRQKIALLKKQIDTSRRALEEKRETLETCKAARATAASEGKLLNSGLQNSIAKLSEENERLSKQLVIKQEDEKSVARVVKQQIQAILAGTSKLFDLDSFAFSILTLSVNCI